MTQRSIPVGTAQTIVIRVGVNVLVRGWEGDQVIADVNDRWGMQVERKKDSIEVKMGGSGQVLVPFSANVRVYSGKSLEIQAVHGDVTALSGFNLKLRESGRLVQASAGGSMDIECESILGNELKLSAGRDLRCYVRSLDSARLKVNDIGGYWEATIGSGQVTLSFKAGGDVTVVTDHKVEPVPPDYIMGKVVKPDSPAPSAPQA